MNYKSASYLKKGDHVRILCTARSADERQLQPAQKLLESWGLQVSFGNTIGKKEHQFGGTKEERLADFQQAIDDPETLFGESQSLSIQNTFSLTSQVITAPIVGGNLSILYSLLGSDSFPETEDHILFIEEIDEYLYHIERMMYSLKRAGKLKGLKALLVGGMTDMNDHEIAFGKNAEEIILSLTAGYDYPVIFNFPAGHIKDHRTLQLGKEMHLEITPKIINFTP